MKSRRSNYCCSKRRTLGSSLCRGPYTNNPTLAPSASACPTPLVTGRHCGRHCARHPAVAARPGRRAGPAASPAVCGGLYLCRARTAPASPGAASSRCAAEETGERGLAGSPGESPGPRCRGQAAPRTLEKSACFLLQKVKWMRRAPLVGLTQRVNKTLQIT